MALSLYRVCCKVIRLLPARRAAPRRAAFGGKAAMKEGVRELFGHVKTQKDLLTVRR
jgi:hypothetical protein